MIRALPRSTRTYTLFPYTTLFRSGMPASGAHDLNEVAPGLMLSSSNPILYLDGRKNPTKPKLLAVGEDERVTGGIHSNRWPNKATEDFVMRSEEHKSELQSLMRISYAVFRLKKHNQVQ